MNKPIKVTLPDGSIVDIATREGTNIFLMGTSNFRYFSRTLKKLRKLRYKMKEKSKNPKENNNLIRSICDLYESIDCLIRNANRDTFANKIPQSEITSWLNHVIKVMQSLDGDDDMFKDDVDARVMDSCLTMFQHHHATPVLMALEGDFFQVLASSFKGHKERRSMRSCESVVAIAFHTLATASIDGLLDKWSVERIFNKFEASGFLVLILECTIHYGRGAQYPAPLNTVLAELQSCPGILSRKFMCAPEFLMEEFLKQGFEITEDNRESRKTCGNTLYDLIQHWQETNPFMIHTAIFNRIQGISNLVELVGPLADFEEALVSGRCSCCSEFATTKLKVCARCDFIFYCSKECQKADWKMHKCNCRKLNTAALDRLFSLRRNIITFMSKNIEAVAFQMGTTGLKVSNLAVENSFMPDENGVIPAFEVPPRFKVVPIRNYVAGEFPEWFPDGWNTDPQRKWLKDMAEKVESVCKPAFGTLVIYHAGRIHVDVGTMEQYQAATSDLVDIQMQLGTKYWCSHPVSIRQKYPAILQSEP